MLFVLLSICLQSARNLPQNARNIAHRSISLKWEFVSWYIEDDTSERKDANDVDDDKQDKADDGDDDDDNDDDDNADAADTMMMVTKIAPKPREYVQIISISWRGGWKGRERSASDEAD